MSTRKQTIKIACYLLTDAEAFAEKRETHLRELRFSTAANHAMAFQSVDQQRSAAAETNKRPPTVQVCIRYYR